MKKQSSLRIHNRFKTGSKLRAKLILADEVTIRNISLGGILLETTKRLNINTTYRIQIISSDNNETLTPKGAVVRASLNKRTNNEVNSLPLYTVAFKFIDLQEKEKRFLEKLITKIADNTIFTQEYMNMLENGDNSSEETGINPAFHKPHPK